jgi:hypothetical protein
MTREVVVEDADARGTIEALKHVRRNVDVTVYLWSDERERWRPLTLDEQRAMWDLAHT